MPGEGLGLRSRLARPTKRCARRCDTPDTRAGTPCDIHPVASISTARRCRAPILRHESHGMSSATTQEPATRKANGPGLLVALLPGIIAVWFAANLRLDVQLPPRPTERGGTLAPGGVDPLHAAWESDAAAELSAPARRSDNPRGKRSDLQPECDQPGAVSGAVAVAVGGRSGTAPVRGGRSAQPAHQGHHDRRPPDADQHLQSRAAEHGRQQ